MDSILPLVGVARKGVSSPSPSRVPLLVARVATLWNGVSEVDGPGQISVLVIISDGFRLPFEGCFPSFGAGYLSFSSLAILISISRICALRQKCYVINGVSFR